MLCLRFLLFANGFANLRSNHRAIMEMACIILLASIAYCNAARRGSAHRMVSVNPLTCPVLQDVDADRRGFQLPQRLADQRAGAGLAAGGAARPPQPDPRGGQPPPRSEQRRERKAR